ncbi:hypothetical protein CQA57_06805 [Helicobacter anseris]|uniref:Uncharacterized protein n=1 Tax=Helicobacter anseris TaxID=375926 RepID=A0A3D8J4U8_9HELI|nr:hypothetical protein CQA57_06805 [Helicobacter anseris]
MLKNCFFDIFLTNNNKKKGGGGAIYK